MLTAAVAELDPEKKAKVLETVRTFDAFGEGNDPHNESDMAFFEVDRRQFPLQVDYYALDMQHGSDDPSSVEKTRRVLTIGFASDY